MQILNPEFNGENPAKFSCACLLIEWYLKIYQTIDKDRYTITLLKKAIDYSGSVLFKNKVQGIINYLDSAFWNFVDTYAVESAKPGFFTKIKLDGLKSIEDDLYEYKMRIRNVETQDDALLLMRQINNRMAILDEYLLENDDIPCLDTFIILLFYDKAYSSVLLYRVTSFWRYAYLSFASSSFLANSLAAFSGLERFREL